MMKVKRIALALAASVLAMPPPPAAAETARVPRIGLLMSTTPAAAGHVASAFSEALRDLGRHEGEHVLLEFRWADGQPARFPALAQELVRLRVDAIVASSEDAALAAKQATTTTPIVMVNVANPVEAGLVQSIVAPGGNVTGLSAQLTPEIRAKQLQILKEAVPGLTRVAVLRDEARTGSVVWKDYEDAGRALGLRITFVDVAPSTGLADGFAAMSRARVGAVLVPGHPVFFTERRRLVGMALDHGLPGIFSTREYTEAGGLMSYSARLTDQFRRAAGYVDKILKGARPATLPVEQPAEFELVVNLRTARALKLAIPRALIIRADQVIE